MLRLTGGEGDRALQPSTMSRHTSYLSLDVACEILHQLLFHCVLKRRGRGQGGVFLRTDLAARILRVSIQESAE